MAYDKVQDGKVGMKVLPGPRPTVTDIEQRRARITADFNQSLDQLLTNPQTVYSVFGDHEILITMLRKPPGMK